METFVQLIWTEYGMMADARFHGYKAVGQL